MRRDKNFWNLGWAGKASLALALMAGLAPGWAQSAGVVSDGLKVGAHTQPLNTPEEFVKLKRSAISPVVPALVDLGEWGGLKSQDLHGGNGAFQVAAKRQSAASSSVIATNKLLKWQASASGGEIAAISFESADAFGLRLGVQIDSLPGSALLRVYAQGRRDEAFEIAGQRVLQTLEANLKAGDDSAEGRTWWTPGADGEELTLEIELPAGTPGSLVQISVPSIVHVYHDLSLPLESDVTPNTGKAEVIGNSGACNLDSTCYEEYRSQRDAVARMVYITPAGGYLCTGTLLNDKSSSGTPYFVTANHCISSQTVASTLQTFWFFRTPTCNARTLSSATKTLQNGATLLYTSVSPDATLLRLNDTPPAGAVFAGWDASAQRANASVVALHHPAGDLQKISFGAISTTSTCGPVDVTVMCAPMNDMSGDYYRVKWSQGTTQGGSSGSGLFVGGYLTATLSSGTATCSNRAGHDDYARFDRVYPAMKPWLNPVIDTGAGTGTGGTGDGKRAAVYRFYNTQTGAHFYTANAGERDYVIGNYPAFQYENVAFYAYPAATTDQSPIFRFFNTKTGAHFYTANAAERDYVISEYPVFKYEGPVWFAQTQTGNSSVPIYRFFNTKTGAHFYTVNAAERDFVIAAYPVFKYEGPVYYVWTTQ
ncbi:trypsin-like peptidase domain-containing protein [Diaphorobacter aerolatus]|uniref:Trypsin-like peptidase domain-containing protein n=1 Tax=Diaphorobacter aerolatus TaxID=1288495 RepID=A0A7H0GKW6_9BURK|nr:trypsin-like peptidase domain-containing protein [Diaphorobacter aerolatus]QNP48932.1 trypsin-like peptidase domain-containing protein [Diaphorobacter aerolatus]